ncbi:MAG: PAS domain S-box protein [Betaproteobacteria bacterium]|nr:PAS domain S-box protein [Betaproteobacteria bacterium]MBU6511646.1 PAS domain S-box protein [Betaproteobacteria bacterium]MDE1956391.1 PAS domain S-box protein [Betaproteobacteria bacterium]MDE2151947.1 PAS domain S-box protein [Betaproteobacteria bacterium]MDE2478967.1 PAS domain S-box protein [Betaproteobacteria bacterium]
MPLRERHLPSRRSAAYALAIVLPLAALSLREALAGVYGERPLLVLFMVPITVCALLGGLGPGLLCTALSGLISAIGLQQLPGNFSVTHPRDLLQWSLLAGNGVLASVLAWFVERAQRAESRARELQADTASWYRAVVESSDDAIVGTDLDGMIMGWSHGAQAMFGYTPQQAIGRSMGMLFHPDDAVERQRLMDSVRRGEAVQHHEARRVRSDGSELTVFVSVSPILDIDGRPVGSARILRDVTHLRKAQQELREQVLQLNADLERRVAERTAELSAANRELDAFAYAVSHDLRAPLRAMSGFSQALLEDYSDELPEQGRLYLRQVDIASHKMGELIEGILALSRSTRGEVRRDPVDLSALGEQLLGELAREEPARRVQWEVEPGLRAQADPRMVEAVLRNLLSNAWKYTARAEPARIRLCAAELDGAGGFAVEDNGAGFDMAHAARLFRAFQRLHRQDEFPGLGIGLATAQRIITRHGGTIRAQAAPGQGARFEFTLAPQPAPQAAPAGSPDPAGLSTPT